MDLVEIQILQPSSHTWLTVSRVWNNAQNIALNLGSVQKRYPAHRVRAVDASGRLVDLL